MKFREEVLNVKLAEILRGYRLAANPEIIVSKKKLPDIQIVVGGLKVVLEGKSELSGHALREQAQDRLRLGLADISIAIFYPEGLFEAKDIDELTSNMTDARYSGVVYHWGRDGIQAIELQGRSIGELAEVLTHVFTLYTQNDLLRSKIEQIESVITRLAEQASQPSLFYFTEAVNEKLRAALGIGEEAGKEEEG